MIYKQPTTKLGNRKQISKIDGIARDPEKGPYKKTVDKPIWKDPRRIT